MNEELSPLTAVSPVDGRYWKACAPLAAYFSESALIRYRLRVEVEYFIALCQLPLQPLEKFDPKHFPALRDLYLDFSIREAERVKAIEAVTNHDVKSVEYYLKEAFTVMGLADFAEFIHFGLTSQDINNTAMPLALKEAWLEMVAPQLLKVLDDLRKKADQWKAVPMLARTHGQPASPTTVGKEIYVFVDRIEAQLTLLETLPFSAKFGGATGNFNAHCAAFPEIDWIGFANRLVNETLCLKRCQVTTQIEHYDNLAAFCDALKRINTILIDLDRDLWTYISFDYFKQRIKAEEVGSSAMPHKVNPIDFENSEGNLGMANAVLAHLSEKLPISRMQRDLTDSTVIRNIGVPLGHTLIGLSSLLRGLSKIILNDEKIRSDLDANWAVVAEGIQTILRREGYPKPFEALKALTRTHDRIDEAAISAFIDTLDVSNSVKEELRRLTPETYIGRCAF